MKEYNIKRIVTFTAILLLLFTTFSSTLLVAQASIIDESQPVSLTIHTYAVPDDGTYSYDQTGNDSYSGAELSAPPTTYDPLKGVTFAAYLIPDTAAGEHLLALEHTTAVPDSATYTPVGTVTTDADGVATFEDLQNGGDLDQGRYLIVETGSPEHVTHKSVNFVVDLPYTSADNTSFDYDVHVYPKNYTALGKVELTKTVEGGPLNAGLFAKFKLQSYNGTDYVDMAAQLNDLQTNADGKIIVDNLLVGNYRFIETQAPTGYAMITDPIEFSITKDASEGVVELTADNKALPTIKKRVSADGINFPEVESVGANDVATWKITPEVPTDIDTYSSYIVTDTVDSRLNIVQDSVVVNSGVNTLAKDTDYELSIVNNVITVTFISDTFTAGQTALNPAQELNITYQTTIDMTQGNILGVEIGSVATLSFNNGTANATVDSYSPSVYTGGIYLDVIDSKTNTPIKGAKFSIYASENDALYETDKIDTLTSGDNGDVLFKGLSYGATGQAYNAGSKKYYIVVDEAPAGYHLYGEVIEVTVNHGSHNDTNTTQIELLEKSALPLTGGQGTVVFYLIGISMIALATIFLIQYKKKI